jgi:hypothetical protein
MEEMRCVDVLLHGIGVLSKAVQTLDFDIHTLKEIDLPSHPIQPGLFQQLLPRVS